MATPDNDMVNRINEGKAEGISKDKIWPEQDMEERLETLRREILNCIALIGTQDLVNKELMQHQHGMNGQILTAIETHFPIQRHIPMSLRIKE